VALLPEIKGTNVILREIRETDIDDRAAIGRHNEFVHMCGGERMEKAQYPERSYYLDWYENYKKEDCAFIVEIGGKCVGTARFHKISQTDKSASYAIGIFDPNLHSKGIGTEVTALMLEYGFETLKLHRIELRVLDYNKRGIRCYEKCGFKIDGVLRESAFVDGAYHSDIVMSILEDEFRQKNLNKD